MKIKLMPPKNKAIAIGSLMFLSFLAFFIFFLSGSESVYLSPTSDINITVVLDRKVTEQLNEAFEKHKGKTEYMYCLEGLLAENKIFVASLYEPSYISTPSAVYFALCRSDYVVGAIHNHDNGICALSDEDKNFKEKQYIINKLLAANILNIPTLNYKTQSASDFSFFGVQCAKNSFGFFLTNAAYAMAENSVYNGNESLNWQIEDLSYLSNIEEREFFIRYKETQKYVSASHQYEVSAELEGIHDEDDTEFDALIEKAQKQVRVVINFVPSITLYNMSLYHIIPPYDEFPYYKVPACSKKPLNIKVENGVILSEFNKGILYNEFEKLIFTIILKGNNPLDNIEVLNLLMPPPYTQEGRMTDERLYKNTNVTVIRWDFEKVEKGENIELSYTFEGNMDDKCYNQFFTFAISHDFEERKNSDRKL